MKRILKAAIVVVFLSAGQSVMASPFPQSAESNVGQSAADTYVDRLEREGLGAMETSAPYPMAAENCIGQGVSETYADRHVDHGERLGSVESPFPVAADA